MIAILITLQELPDEAGVEMHLVAPPSGRATPFEEQAYARVKQMLTDGYINISSLSKPTDDPSLS